MNNLLISGNTDDLKNWDFEGILTTKSKDQYIDQLLRYEWDNKISTCGMTYLEIDQINNTYNNWK